MRERRRALSLFLVFTLLLNLLLPMSLVSATSGTDGGKTDCTNVADDVYAEEQEPCEEEEQGLGFGLLGGIMPLANPPVEINDHENLIGDVKIWDKPNDEGEPTAESREIQNIRPGTGEKLSVQYSWELPAGHGYSKGDTFAFQLPDKFQLGLPLEGNIAGEGGINVGTYTVSSEGQVIFTFNDEIDGGIGFKGEFYVWRQFDASKLEESTKQDIVFEYNGTAHVTIPVHFTPSASERITKSGQAYQNGTENSRNSDEIEWVVNFNIGEETISSGAIFKDTFTPAGLTIDQSSIEVIQLDVDINGNVSESIPKAVFNNYSFANIANGFQLTFNEEIKKAYRVKYTTTVAAPSVSNPDYNPTYKNNVTVEGTTPAGSFAQSKTANVPVQFNEPLNKKVVPNGYDSAAQTITWEIEYNYNQQNISQAEAWIKDTFGVEDASKPNGFDNEHQELASGAGKDGYDFYVYKVEIGSDGKAITNPAPVLVNPANYTLTLGDVNNANEPSFTLQFNNAINSAYKIVYKTKAKNRVHDGSKKVVNKVEMIGGVEKERTQNIGQEVFKKDNGSINYNTKKITWTIHVNKDGHDMDNVVITDNFAGQGLTLFDDNTFRITDKSTNTVLTEGTDYTLAPYNNGQANPTYSQGFKVTFIGSKATINKYHTITYVTDFDPTFFDNNPGVTKQYQNNADITWAQKPTGTTWTKTGTVNPNNYMVNNGEKRASYNAQTKEITWTIDVNFNRHTIDKAVVRDFYTNGQNFVAGSLEVYPLTISTDGGVSPGTKLNGGYEVDYDVTDDGTEDGNKGFALTFDNQINTAYRIMYKTSLVGEPVLAAGYSNQATLHDETDPNNKKLLFTDNKTVTPLHRGEYVNKLTPVQGLGAEQVYATWTVNINRSQSYVLNAELTDTLSANQILQQDSFKLYQPTVATNGTIGAIGTAMLVNPSKYTIAFTTDENTGADSFTLTFKEPIENAYILQYKSFLNADHGEPVSNSVIFNGHRDNSGTTSHNANKNASFSGGASSKVFASGTAKIKIKKVDAADNAIPLAGAVFDLYDESGTNLLETLTTDANGEAETTDKHKYKKYLLKEISAPDEYVINPDYATGKLIIFDKDGSDDVIFEVDSDGNKMGNPYTFTNKKGNWAFELTKVDEDDNSIVLAGAKFKLQKETSPGNGDYVDVNPQPANLTTGADGKIRLSRDDVELDVNYRLIEIEAPTGYELDQTTTIDFKIKSDQTDLETAQMTNKVLTNGSVKLTKIDKHTNQQLQGAEFKLEYNQGGAGVWTQYPDNTTTYTTDANGEIKVTGLDGGQYRFVEVTPPTGYELNTAELRFDLIAGEMSKEVTFSNEITPRSITLTKLGDNSEKLAGAIFELQDGSGQLTKDINGQIIAHGTTAQDGTLTFNNLRPGKYQLVEITPPKGYKLDSTPIPVEIDQTTISISLDITNSLVDDGSVTIVKVDEEYNEILLEGAIFQIIDLATGDLAQDKDGNLLDKLTTDADGQLTVTNLKAGKYRVVEVEAPEGYHLGGQVFEFEIDQEGQVETYTFKNKIMRGSVTLTKIRKGYPDNKLKGAEFTLYNEDGTIVKDQNGQELTGLTTNDNGQLVIPDLRPGTYYFLETKAPSGYKLSTEKISFTISKGNGGAPSAEIIAENERRPSGGGGGGTPPKPEEDPKKPEEDPNKPKDPNDPKKPIEPKDPEKPEEDPKKPKDPNDPDKPIDPKTPINPEQPRENDEQDEQDTDSAVGNTSDQAGEDLDSLHKDSRRLGDADAQAAQGKGLLPQTGEALPWTPFLGILLIALALVLWFRKEQIQG